MSTSPGRRSSGPGALPRAGTRVRGAALQARGDAGGVPPRLRLQQGHDGRALALPP
jgi:hypothetical protein